MQVAEKTRSYYPFFPSLPLPLHYSLRLSLLLPSPKEGNMGSGGAPCREATVHAAKGLKKYGRSPKPPIYSRFFEPCRLSQCSSTNLQFLVTVSRIGEERQNACGLSYSTNQVEINWLLLMIQHRGYVKEDCCLGGNVCIVG